MRRPIRKHIRKHQIPHRGSQKRLVYLFCCHQMIPAEMFKPSHMIRMCMGQNDGPDALRIYAVCPQFRINDLIRLHMDRIQPSVQL